jgi:hypothetical protein
MKTTIHFLSYHAQFFLEWKKNSHKGCRETRKTYFMFNNVFSEIVPYVK